MIIETCLVFNKTETAYGINTEEMRALFVKKHDLEEALVEERQHTTGG